MTVRGVVVAGWLAMLSAFVSLPLAYLGFVLERRGDSVSMLLLIAAQVGGVALFVAITLFLKRFLNSFFQFHDTDRSMYLMIMANITAVLLLVCAYSFPQAKEYAGNGAMAMMIMQGVVQVRFGYRLLKLPADLGGLLKPYCYLNILTGVCVMSVVLILFGIVISAISDLMLGTIFLNLARQMKTAQDQSEM